MNRLIESSPYTKEQILEIFKAEPELDYDEIIVLGVSLEYMREKGKNSKKLEQQFIKRRDKLMKFYK